jgi:membrane protein CcdC involved in cytochrome C biogenesis
MIRELLGAGLIFLWLLIASTEYAATPDPIWFSIAKCIALIAIALVLFAMFEPHQDN